MFGLSSYISSEMMFYITPQTLTVGSGILSALAGVVWFLREKKSQPPEPAGGAEVRAEAT
jgi:hypothetical protein